MKRFLLLFILLVATNIAAFGQIGASSGVRFYGNRPTDPAACSPLYGNLYWNNSSNAFKYCSATNTWTAFGAGGGGAAIGSPVTGATQGSVLFAGAGGNLAQDNINFFWDNTNKQLRVGNTSTSDLMRLDLQNGATAKYINFTYDNGSGTYGSLSQVPYGLGFNGLFNFSFNPGAGYGVILGRNSLGTDSPPPGKVSIANDTTTLPSLNVRMVAAQTADAAQFQTSAGANVFSVNAAGAVRGSQATVTANSTLSASTTIVNSASATTQTLPTAVGQTGLKYVVKNTGAGTTTVTTTGGQTIFVASAVTTQNLLTGDSFTYESTGANWIAY